MSYLKKVKLFIFMDIQAVGLIQIPTAGQLFKLFSTDISGQNTLGDDDTQNSALHNINWFHLGL